MLKAKKAENNKIIKSGFLGFCRGKYEASGCFIGGEVGLAVTDNWIWFNIANNVNDLSPNVKSVNPIVNLTFGYQWYYMQNQGLRVKANIGYANYNATFKDIEWGYNDGRKQTFKMNKNTNAVQYGLEIAWLWDFVRSGKHTLGLDLSSGFEASTLIGDIDNGDKDSKMAFKNFTNLAWITRIGLHYYFNVNHQIGLAYAYKGYSAVNGQKSESNMLVNGEPFARVATSPRNQILLSYAYKF
ncbi:hypothetical protein [Helicobacter sp. T3_23-1056]